MSIEVTDLSFAYGSHIVLNKVSFSVHKGRFTALLGANGAGKSTLFRCILGFLPHYQGCITLCGQDIRTLDHRQQARLAAYIPQISAPVFNYTVLETVLMGASGSISPLRRPDRKQRERALEMLERLGVGHLARCGVNEISGGERQMALIARAMLQQAQILIMDEPTANLDYGNQYRVLETVRGLTENGYTVLMSTHNPEHARRFATDVLALKDGAVYADGPSETTITPTLIEALYQIPAAVWENNGREDPCI